MNQMIPVPAATAPANAGTSAPAEDADLFSLCQACATAEARYETARGQPDGVVPEAEFRAIQERFYAAHAKVLATPARTPLGAAAKARRLLWAYDGDFPTGGEHAEAFAILAELAAMKQFRHEP